jgi:hypothetical protein
MRSGGGSPGVRVVGEPRRRPHAATAANPRRYDLTPGGLVSPRAPSTLAFPVPKFPQLLATMAVLFAARRTHTGLPRRRNSHRNPPIPGPHLELEPNLARRAGLMPTMLMLLSTRLPERRLRSLSFLTGWGPGNRTVWIS